MLLSRIRVSDDAKRIAIHLNVVANNNTSLLPGAGGRIVCQQCGETMANEAQTACEDFLRKKYAQAQ